MYRYVVLRLLAASFIAGVVSCAPPGPPDPAGDTGPAGHPAFQNSPPSYAASVRRLQEEVDRLQSELDRFSERAPYIVIDTVHNRLQLRRGTRIFREAVCAAGSGKRLLGPEGKVWYFGTPKGYFRVRRKVKDPIWKKPEWAFVEQNRPAPVLPWDFSRLDVTTLGKYALELGDGYEIHGTLYPNLLGRHITHGCIRLNDKDLEAAYAFAEVGSRVFIY